LSPRYSQDPEDRKRFIRSIKDIKIAKAEEEINTYLEMTFADLDTLSENKKQKSHANFVAYQIDLFGKEYGWTIKEILETPLRQVFQLNTAIAERYSTASGKKYTKMRAVDLMEAQAILEQAKKRKVEHN
jgi:hypothetical protein